MLSAVHDPSLHWGKSVHYPHIIAWRAWEHHKSRASRVRDTMGRRHHHLPELGGVLGAVGVFAGMRVALVEFL